MCSQLIEHDEQYHTIRQLRTGESFGQPNLLLHGLKQKTTIIWIDETECLTVDKDSFDKVLRLTHEIEWMALLSTLRNHWLFHNWNDADIESCKRINVYRVSTKLCYCKRSFSIS